MGKLSFCMIGRKEGWPLFASMISVNRILQMYSVNLTVNKKAPNNGAK
jgi:hypothetical protein